MNLLRRKSFFVFCSALCILHSALPSVAAGNAPQGQLENGLIKFDAPPDDSWTANPQDPPQESAIFTTKTRQGQMAIILLAKDATVDANAAVAILKELRARRAKSGVKVIMPATIEKDSRFDIRIREKYMQKTAAGESAIESLQLYKSVGPRVVELVVYSLSDGTDLVKNAQKDGEDVLLSAKYDKDSGK
jgi:hypothetical protein